MYVSIGPYRPIGLIRLRPTIAKDMQDGWRGKRTGGKEQRSNGKQERIELNWIKLWIGLYSRATTDRT
jgi:hypothetical protein